MRIHHIGYLVEDLSAAQESFESLGFTAVGETVMDASREAYILFLENNGYTVELIQPSGEGSPIYGLLKKYRNAPYHLCYSVYDLHKAIEEMTKPASKTRFTLIQPPRPAPAIPGCPDVAFLMNRHIGMIELVELIDLLE